MLYLFDKNKEVIDMIDDVYSSHQELTKNGLITHIVQAKYSESFADAQFFGLVDADDSNVFWMYKIDLLTTSGDLINVHGTYVLFDDLDGRGGVIRDRRPQNQSVINILPDILDGTGWEVGSVNSSARGTSNYYFVSKIEAFWDFLEKWNVEYKPSMSYSVDSNGILRITKKQIHIYDQLSDDFGKWYEHGSDLLEVTREVSTNHIYTAYIGRGRGEEVGETNDGNATYGRKILFDEVEWSQVNGDPVDKPLGQDYVELPNATDEFGYEDNSPRFTVVDFDSIEDREELLQATYDYALNNARKKVQFKSTVIENGLAELGETVAIIDDDRGIRYKTRIFKLKKDFLNNKVKEIEFGDEIVKNNAQRQRANLQQIKQLEEEQDRWLNAVMNSIVNSYFNEDGYNYDLHAGNQYGLPGGYYSFDAPIDMNPSKVVYMGAGKILIANSKLPNGDWEWRTAMTGDGIVADEINTGVLRADLIQSGFNNINPTVHIDEFGFSVSSPNGTRETMLENAGLTWYRDDLRQARMYLVDSSSRGTVGLGQTLWDDNFMGWYIEDDSGLTSVMYIDGHTAALNLDNNELINVNQIHFDDPRTSRIYKSASKNLIVETDNALTLRSQNRARLESENDNVDLLAATTIDLIIGGSRRINADVDEVTIFRNLDMNSNTIINQSDIRLKKFIVDSQVDALKEIDRLEFIEFEWDKVKNPDAPDGKQFGIKAQYAPFLQTKAANSESYLSIDMGKHVNLNSKAIQELHVENKQLKSELDDLKNMLIDKGVI